VSVLVLSVLIVMACGGGVGSLPTGKKIALLVPETTTARFDTRDRPYFEAKLTRLCSDCKVLFSKAGQQVAQQAQAKTAISHGASVIVLDPVDAASAAPIVAMAKAANIPVISYDQLITNSADLNYHVSFDDAAIGPLQATALLKAIGTKSKPTIVEINGDAGDGKAALFKQGVHSVLDGKVTFGKESSATGWSPAAAEAAMQSALKALNKKVDGVLAANDALAGGAIAALYGAGLTTLPPVTGQGADLEAIQRIITGDQYMTVYESIRAEAEAAAQLAYDLAFGVAVPAATTDGKTVNNGAADIPWVMLSPVAVTRANIESTVVADGFWAPADICTSNATVSQSRVSLPSACAGAGIS
jgi:D-xylose transport system substrate-binding protein